MATRVKVRKWGKSIAVVIPSRFAKMRSIEVGSVIDLEPLGSSKSKRRRCTLDELLAKCKAE